MDKSQIDEQRLLLLEARAGNSKALDELMERLRPMVTRIARGYFLTNGDSSDLIQEGMLGLYKAFLSYRLDSPVTFEHYAGTCVRRQIINAVRTSLNKKNLPLYNYMSIGAQGGVLLESNDTDEDSEDFEYALPSAELSPEERVMILERSREINRYLADNLSEFERKVLKLYLDGASYKVIAKTLDKTVKSIDNAILRIKNKLKNLEG